MSAKAAVLRGLFRAYPFQKGRYRLMMLFEKCLDRRGTALADFEDYGRLSLDLASPGLERTFFYFMPERYEHETQEYIRKVVEPGMRVMDVGAHHGLFTVLLASRVGKEGRVYSFEPEEGNFSKLKRNIELNGLTQVTAERLALSDFCGSTQLVLTAADTGHFLGQVSGQAPVNGGQRQEVPVTTLDAFVEERGIGRIDLIKIDAEASEHLILKGAVRTLSDGKAPRIVCETHSSHRSGAVGQDRVRALFYAQGYRSYVLNSKLSGRDYLSELLPGQAVTGLQNVLYVKEPLT